MSHNFKDLANKRRWLVTGMRREHSRRKQRSLKRAPKSDRLIVGELERLRRENEALRAASGLLATRHEASESESDASGGRIEAELAALRGNNAQLRVEHQELLATVRRLQEGPSFRSDDEAWPLSPQSNPWLARPVEPDATLFRLVPPLIREGGYLWKVPQAKALALPKRRWFRIGSRGREADIALTWCDPRKGGGDETGFSSPETTRLKSFKLAAVVEVRLGHETAAWCAQAASRGTSLPARELCWSLVTHDQVTLDLAAESLQEARLWQDALRRIVSELRHRRPVVPPETTKPTTQRSRTPSPSGTKSRLATAIREARLEEVKSLLSSRRTDEVIDTATGDTALLLACRLGMTPVVDIALALGARNDPHPTWGGTALQLAVAGGHVAAARALLEAAAGSGADGAIANHVILANDSAAKLTKGDAPLHVAAKLLDVPTVQVLVEHHADVLARDEQGRTAAHAALDVAQDRAYDVLSLLLDCADDEILDATDDARGDTLLHVAARLGAKRCVQLLVQAAAHPSHQNKAGETPHQTALRAGKYEVAAVIRGYDDVATRAVPERPRSYSEGGRCDDESEASSVRDSIATSPVAWSTDRGGFYTSDGDQWTELFCEAEQYPYFLHVTSGHTQWLDPRQVMPQRTRNPSELPPRSPRRDNANSSPSKRRSLSGGPIATAVDMYTVAGGKRESSPARPAPPLVGVKPTLPRYPSFSSMQSNDFFSDGTEDATEQLSPATRNYDDDALVEEFGDVLLADDNFEDARAPAYNPPGIVVTPVEAAPASSAFFLDDFSSASSTRRTALPTTEEACVVDHQQPPASPRDDSPSSCTSSHGRSPTPSHHSVT